MQLQLAAGELVAKFFIGAAYMGTFIMLLGIGFHIWDSIQEKRRKAKGLA